MVTPHQARSGAGALADRLARLRFVLHRRECIRQTDVTGGGGCINRYQPAQIAVIAIGGGSTIRLGKRLPPARR